MTQASGRRRATPVRRGKPGGVGPVFRRTASPAGPGDELGGEEAGDGGDPPELGRLSHPEHGQATGPDERQAPLGRDRRRGECLRERRHPPSRSPAPRPGRGQPARCPAPRRPGSRTGAAPPRAARPLARAARQRAGSPGEPFPEPTSTIGPSLAARTGSALRASASSTRRAPARSSEVSPGVSTTARSQSSSAATPQGRARRRRSGSARRLRSSSSHPACCSSAVCTILRSAALIGSSSTRSLCPQHLLGAAGGDRLERPAAALAVPRSVDDDLFPFLAAADDRRREDLERVDRLAVAADQEPEVVADTGRR